MDSAEGKVIQNWDDNKVARFIEGVGSGQVWAHYASKCLAEGVDGQTLYAANVDDLTEMGFSKMHAKAVIAARDAYCVPLVIHSSSSIITESELALISELNAYRDKLTASAARIATCLENLTGALLSQQVAVNELVDQEIAKWERARTAALARLKAEELQFREQINHAQATLTKDLQRSQTAASRINTLCSSPVRPDEIHLLQYRQTQVSELVQQSVTPFPTIIQEPAWTIVTDSELLIDVKTDPCVLSLVHSDLPTLKSAALYSVGSEKNSLDAPPPYVDDDIPRVSSPTPGIRSHGIRSHVPREPQITDLGEEVKILLKKYDGGKGYIMTRDCSIYIIPECLKLLKEAKLKYWRLHNPNLVPSIIQQYELTCRNMRIFTDQLCASALDPKISFLVHLATFERNLMTLDQHWGK